MARRAETNAMAAWLARADEARAWELSRQDHARLSARPSLRHGHHLRHYQLKTAGTSLAEQLPGGLDPASAEAIHALLPEVSTHLLDARGTGPDPALSAMVSRVLGLPVGSLHGPASDSIPHPARSN